MPSLTDYSDYFTITGLPETKSFSHSDSITLSDSFSKSVSTWRKTFTLSLDAITTSDSLSRDVSDWKFVRSVSDSFGLSDTLSRSVETWRYIESHSDSTSISDSFSKSVYTYRTTVSLSETITNSDSLTKAVDTWRHILSYNMSLSVSDSLTRATEIWREVHTPSDSISFSETFSTNVERWKYYLTPSDTVESSDAFTKTVDDWKLIKTNSETITVGDNFSISIGISDDIYFYDNVGLKDSTILRGTIAGGNFTSDTSAVLNPSALIDGNASLSATFKNTASNKSCTVFDLGSQKTISFIAVHLNVSLNGNLEFYGSNSQGSGWTSIGSGFSSTLGWTLIRFDANYRYYAVQCESLSSDSKIGEVLIGDEFIPEIRYDMGSSYDSVFDNKQSESLNGAEYIYKTKDETKRIIRNYSNISSSLKAEFETLSKNANTYKMIYTFDNVYNYGLVEPMKFQEVSHNRYQTKVTIQT